MAERFWIAEVQDKLKPSEMNILANNTFMQVDSVNDLTSPLIENVNVVYSKEDYTAFRRLAPGIGKDKWETTGAISA
jgi:hypothetical protein